MARTRKIRYASVCDGIGAVHVAWAPLGWTCRWVSEIDPFPMAVVERRYGLRNVGDMTKITEADIGRYGAIDLLVGGTPCQSFSVAGLRKGLDDPRGNLALRFLQLAGAMRPRWVLWENVPGVLSSLSHRAPDPCPPPPPVNLGCDGAEVETDDEYDSEEVHAFNTFLAGLSQLGYGFAYRVLDAKYFGVPQRRRRVFVVGCLGDWRRAAAVLLERHGLCGHPAPSRQTGAEVAHSLARGSCGSHGRYDPNGEDFVTCGTLSASHGRYDPNGEDFVTCGTLSANGKAAGFDASEDGTGRGTPLVPVPFDTTQVTSKANYSAPQPGDPCHPLAKQQHPPAIAYRTSGNHGAAEQGDRTAALNCNTDRTQQIIAYQCQGSNVGPAGHLRAGNGNETGGVPKEIADALTSSEGGSHADSKPHVTGAFGVRRLTPRECERLQGFPDDYTLIKYRGKPAKDGPRYKALGNSMAVPVMQWIGGRIALVETLKDQRAHA